MRGHPILKRSLLGLTLILLLLASGGFWLSGRLRASLPRLDGELALGGPSAPIRIDRDGLGVPTLRAANREDVAFGTGFVHAQDRFFQMDLNRRSAAGELAELFGPPLLPDDRRVRPHQLRQVARRALAAADPVERRLIGAYTAGVNAGLASLGEKPFEYLALRTDPVPWRPEDTLLTILSMFVQLQDEDARIESAMGLLHETLPLPLADFLAPAGTPWDAPLVGKPFASPPVPGPEVCDLRRTAAVGKRVAARSSREVLAGLPKPWERRPAGSNNWAVSGAHTADGRALVANDMHLGLAVPNVWYRASFEWPDSVAGGLHQVTGATLPGAPPMVIGSNRHVAWGFTNGYVDDSDLVLVDPDPAASSRYLTPEGPRELTHARELIRVRGGTAETLDVVSTLWGPIVGHAKSGRRYALRWTAQEPEAVDLHFVDMETARDVKTALEVANRSGMPSLNVIAGDDAGHIGWTVSGKVPRRQGFDGHLPASWADGTRGWNGWLAPEEVPRVIDPESGRLWTANNRVVDGAMLGRLGDGGYILGARAGQIRDRLLALDRATPADMLKIQLDDQARFLEHWRKLLIETLPPPVVAADPRRRALLDRVQAWDGYASVGSVGYRIVRGFRQLVATEVFAALTAPCKRVDPQFDYLRVMGNEEAELEGPLWRLVSEKPPHLLPPGTYKSWDGLLLAMIDLYLERQLSGGVTWDQLTWGRFNTVRMQHPLSLAAPQLGRWLDMPADELPGGADMPRFQTPYVGASQRMAVSPGREEQGYFHMPGGQSGHPWSPHYRDGNRAWVRGEATPFLPGSTVHTLRLVPRGAAPP